jgi:hypothetical protein
VETLADNSYLTHWLHLTHVDAMTHAASRMHNRTELVGWWALAGASDGIGCLPQSDPIGAHRFAQHPVDNAAAKAMRQSCGKGPAERTRLPCRLRPADPTWVSLPRSGEASGVRSRFAPQRSAADADRASPPGARPDPSCLRKLEESARLPTRIEIQLQESAAWQLRWRRTDAVEPRRRQLPA